MNLVLCSTVLAAVLSSVCRPSLARPTRVKRKFKKQTIREFTGVNFSSAAHYWPLNSTANDLQLIDIRGNSSAMAINRIKPTVADQLGTVLSLDGKDDIIVIRDIQEKCIVDPTYCTEGLSVAFWLKYTKGEFIISGGSFGNNAHGPGFRFICQGCVKKKGLHVSSSRTFLLELSTRTQRWKLIMESIPKWWFHFAFTWTKEKGLSFYENGKRVMSNTNSEPVKSRDANDETPHELTIGQPNSIYKMNSYGKLSIGHLVIWTNALSPHHVEMVFRSLLTENTKSISCCDQMKVDPCLTNPCHNGATCQPMNGKYECVCPDVDIFQDCSKEKPLSEPCLDKESVDCEKLANQEGYCRYHWRRMRKICPKACKFCAWKADMKKETTTSLEVLPDPTPGSYEHKTSLRATFTVPTTAVVGRVERQSPQGLSQTLFIVIMCSAIGAVVLLIVILVYLFTRFYRRRKGEFVPDESYPHYQSIQERRTAGNNGGGIPSFVDPSLPRITDVPHKPSRAETTGRGAAGKKKKSMGVKITYKPPEWD